MIELKNPKKRTFDLDLIEKIINEKAEGAIEVNSVRLSNRNEVVRIKDTPAEKSYTIRFLISELEASEYEILTKNLIHQNHQAGVAEDNKKAGSKRADSHP